jgi:cell division protein FtsB
MSESKDEVTAQKQAPSAEQVLLQMDQSYARLCTALGHIKANQNKLQKEETAILAHISKLDEEAGMIRAAIANAAATVKGGPAS